MSRRSAQAAARPGCPSLDARTFRSWPLPERGPEKKVFSLVTDSTRLPPIAPGRLPCVGHLVRLAQNPMRFLQSLRAIDELVRIYIGPTPVCIVNSPELLHQMLVSDASKFHKGRLFDKAKAILGNGVFTAEADRHLRQRRLIQPAFHHEQIASWVTVMSRSATETVDAWESGRSIDLLKEMHDLSLKVVLRTLFDSELGHGARQRVHEVTPVLIKELVTQLLYPGWVPAWLPLPGNRRFNRAAAELRNVFDEVTAAYRAEGVDRGDILSVLCGAGEEETGYCITDEQVRDEAVSLLLAGTETTATVLSWLCYEMGRNPEIQERVRAEVLGVIGDREPTHRDLKELPFLRQVVNEILRLYTPNWILTRRANTDVDMGQFSIPAGTDILFCLSALHRDPALYPQPMTFNPERWADRKGGSARDTFMPFLTGRRKCIGDAFATTEIMIAAIAIVRRRQLAVHPGTTVTESKLMATLQPKGLRMVATDIPHSPSPATTG